MHNQVVIWLYSSLVLVNQIIFRWRVCIGQLLTLCPCIRHIYFHWHFVHALDTFIFSWRVWEIIGHHHHKDHWHALWRHHDLCCCNIEPHSAQVVINTRRNCKQHAYVLWISNMCVLFIHDAMFLLALWISCLVPAGAPVLGLNTTVAACCIVKSQCLWKSHIAGLEVPTSMLAATTLQDGPALQWRTAALAHGGTCSQGTCMSNFISN